MSVNFPHQDFIAIPKYPGYYWDFRKEKLFSIKVVGILKELKLKTVNSYQNNKVPSLRGMLGREYYELSKNNRVYRIFVSDIRELANTDYIIPQKERM